MERRLSRRDEKFALALVAMANNALKAPRWIQAPTHPIAQALKNQRAARGMALALVS